MTKNKKGISIIFSFALASVLGLLATSVVLAATAKLNWTAPTQNADGTPLTDLGGYKVYWGTTSRGTATNPPSNYTGSQDVGNVTEYTVNSISDTGRTYFSVTAKDTSANESGFSNEVNKTPGDVDLNSTVDSLDVRQVVLNWNKSSSQWSTQHVDINLDNAVNSLDIRAVVLNWNM